ncbi:MULTISPECIES: hypothetical protein [Erwinia]|uniref:Acyl carrier protein n=2 Tax=Erwinia TaxID=551 RepID=A0A014NJC9_9GAMM|nr:hypothetical protein [Erwinia mallotivora]EXU73910.1 hypothetical protein BG55_19905 [Erwinia mallotivora]
MHTETALSPLELTARRQLSATLLTPVSADELDPALNMREAYGLTSLNKILFITSLCNEMAIGLGCLTEEDLANMHSLADVCRILNKQLAQ